MATAEVGVVGAQGGALYRRLVEGVRRAHSRPFGLNPSASCAELSRRLSSELGYSVPSRKGLPARLEALRVAASGGAAAAREAWQHLEVRRRELARALEEVEAQLGAPSIVGATVESVSALLSRREAVSFLLGLIPAEPPAAEVSDWQAAQRREVEAARAWLERLKQERDAIRLRVDEHERSGAVLDSVYLQDEVAAVFYLIAVADENLRLVK